MTGSGRETDFAALDAKTMVEGFAAGSFDPVDVLEATMARIERFDPVFKAFVMRDVNAKATAEASAARYRDGQAFGPLDGVPIAIKDNLVVAGMPATWGSRLFADTVCADDELPVARIRAAGAVIVGKTNTPEFAVEGYTGNALFGVTGNPWNPSLTPGGSSGGSVAAVASRMLSVALGTDGGGSIRRPAAYTGLVGLKPSIGRIPRHGGLPQVLLDFEVVGPIARTVHDVALAYRVMAGPDIRDPASRLIAGLGPVSEPECRRLRILYVESFGDAPCDPEIRASVRAAADALSGLGHDVVEGPLPLPIARLNELWPEIGSVGLARLAEEQPRFRALASRKYVDMAERGAALGAVRIAEIVAEVQRLRGLASECFAALDAIMTPACAAMPWAAHVSHPEVIDGHSVGPRGHAVYTGWVNAIGHPAIVLPAAPASNGLPIGFQVVGDIGAEELLLALAERYEQEAPWASRQPALAIGQADARGMP